MSTFARAPEPQVDTVAVPLSILGVPVTPFDSLEDAARCAHDRIAAGVKTFCVAINPEKIQYARRNAALKRAVGAASLHLCDGVGVSFAAALLHGRKLARCTGVDLFIELVRLAAAKRWKVFLLGGTPESNEGARLRLLERFPGIKLAGWRDGYFSNSREVVDQINASGADVLFVAMGSPRQELWIAEHFDRLRPVLCMGVGGSFDVLSGKARRAPLLFRRSGTEWLFRLLMHPKRLRRQLALPAFAFQVIRERLCLKFPSSAARVN